MYSDCVLIGLRGSRPTSPALPPNIAWSVKSASKALRHPGVRLQHGTISPCFPSKTLMLTVLRSSHPDAQRLAPTAFKSALSKATLD
ncbi:hypothetical protein B0H19DRAFT_1087792 [Mycena capillaripes]|nr:hypothetical protein B0H19DRAFT_1154364 [Mycena capillaripes]KAJ6556400.1 hypothetical protein B0H19DRAFT_1152511 [Mycena capillaripes]KAJ6592409.1 hypothetical protein B0H19DRAFT_1087792 [Mycena capillaripes]